MQQKDLYETSWHQATSFLQESTPVIQDFSHDCESYKQGIICGQFSHVHVQNGNYPKLEDLHANEIVRKVFYTIYFVGPLIIVPIPDICLRHVKSG